MEATFPTSNEPSREQILAEREDAIAARESDLAAREQAATPAAPAADENPALAARLAAGYYCPGCGKPAEYRQKCTGTGTAPHPAIEVVDSAELSGDPSGHTAAPASAEA
jgi:hypothetical protein